MSALPERLNGSRTTPGDALLHPLALAAIALLIVNDHLLKQVFPGFVTGKLSDFAGLVFFPLFLVSLYETVASLAAQRTVRVGRYGLIAATGITAIAFTLIKLLPAANDTAALLVGSVQSAIALKAEVRPAVFVLDPTDLVALPCVLIGLAIGYRRTRRP